MDIITLASTAFSFAIPYILKSGEKISENIGQEVWDFIKKPFSKDDTDMTISENQEQFKKELLNKLNEDPDFEKELRTVIETAQKKSDKNIQQNINNNGNIEKQVNIGNVSGNINL